MLYKKNGADHLTEELFRNPTSEYRGTPFWAWNCKLEQSELERQIDVLHEMGFGGFHMHVHTGMDTPYLSDEYMSLVRACVDKAERERMLAWLYDEDRWPSGAAALSPRTYSTASVFCVLRRSRIQSRKKSRWSRAKEGAAG